MFLDIHSRRNFLRVGALGTLTLAQLLEVKHAAAAAGRPTKDTSVVWLWLGGGPTHIETFDPHMNAPVEYRSVTGEVETVFPGVTFGGNFPLLAACAHKLAIVRSFAHTNSGHGGGTHYVMTGYDHRGADNGESPIRPSLGAILARTRGPNHPLTGLPSYVRMGSIYGDGPSFLETAYGPFDSSGQAQQNMRLSINGDHFHDRTALLADIDRINKGIDRSGLMTGFTRFEQQATSIVLGSAAEAFNLSGENAELREQYGAGLGEKLLLARRLCERGCGFVTVDFGGWDMHGGIKAAMNNLGPKVDHAVAAFIEDVCARGLDQKILLVITGEFGRTPKVNVGGGRDHWAPLSTLVLAGGGLTMGQVVGESDSRATWPKSRPVSPQNLMATLFHVLGIPPDITYVNRAGRPVYMLENREPIAELI